MEDLAVYEIPSLNIRGVLHGLDTGCILIDHSGCVTDVLEDPEKLLVPCLRLTEAPEDRRYKTRGSVVSAAQNSATPGSEGIHKGEIYEVVSEAGSSLEVRVYGTDEDTTFVAPGHMFYGIQAA